MNSQMHSSVVMENNYEHKPGTVPPSFNPCFSFSHSDLGQTQRENHAIPLPAGPQAGVQMGAQHIWLYFGFW
jgi:hypothetical protein